MTNSLKTAANTAMEAYKIGDGDTRPWGKYVVTGVGTNEFNEEYCEKQITVNPNQVLSLQSHDLRRELWRVEQGILTVILNDRRIDLKAGQSIEIPLYSIHAMANLGSVPVVVYEKQQGICREEDIRRYVDAYGRGTEQTADPMVAASIAVYADILAEIKARTVQPPLFGKVA